MIIFPIYHMIHPYYLHTNRTKINSSASRLIHHYSYLPYFVFTVKDKSDQQKNELT